MWLKAIVLVLAIEVNTKASFHVSSCRGGFEPQSSQAHQMTYQSIDAIQNALADDVFKHAKDKKKAAGRALGTIVELIAYYMLREWGLGSYLTIELRMPEFGNAEITHNVEFGLHPRHALQRIVVANATPPLTAKKLQKNSLEISKL